MIAQGASRSRRGWCPASGATTWRSSPSSRLTSEDLPDVGPADHGDVDPSARSSAVRGGQALRRRRRAGRRCPSPPRPTPARGSPKPSCVEVELRGAVAAGRRACSRRAAPDGSALRSRAAMSAVDRVDAFAGRPPRTRPDRLRRARARPGAGWPVHRHLRNRAPARRCPPPRTSRPFHSASPKCRSRVVPGRSDTIAWRPPRSRLKSVDLPTLGRPTIATVGLLMRRPGRPGRRRSRLDRPHLHRDAPLRVPRGSCRR